MTHIFIKHTMFVVTGFGVSKKRKRKGKIGPAHRIGKDEAMKWFQQKVRTFLTST